LRPAQRGHEDAIVVPALALVLALAFADERRYDGHAVVRVDATTPADVEHVEAIADEVWTHRPGPGPIDVRVAPQRMAELAALGLPLEIRVPDVQARIDAERDRLAARPDPQEGGDFFADFRDYAEVMAKLDAMAAAAPDVAEVVDIGTSLEGRPIKGLRIGNAGAPAVLYTGTMHAREWLATMVAMCVADAYVSGYGSDAHVTELLDELEIVVLPMINNDLYVVSWTSDRYWRKNTRDGYGVDLNRNFGYAWGGEGASGYPYDETFYGDGPFSEPESAALRDFVEGHGGFVAHIDFHSFAQLVLYPWGHTYDAAPDAADLSSIASAMAGAIAGQTGYDYAPIQGSDLYPASGVVDDWSYGDHAMMAFTIELRGDDFVVPPSEIAPACAENVAAALTLADWALEHTGGAADDGGGDTSGGGSEGGDEPDPMHEDGTGGGESGAHDTAASAADDGAADEDDDAGDAPSDPDALPPGFGLGEPDARGCALAVPHRPSLALAVVALALARRRRRQGM
jgi:carboxypeptidase T